MNTQKKSNFSKFLKCTTLAGDKKCIQNFSRKALKEDTSITGRTRVKMGW